MESLLDRTLYSRVTEGVTCKILAVSPGLKKVYFCEISEGGKIDYKLLNEMDIQTYYNRTNVQDLAPFLELLIEQTLAMSLDRILLKEVRSAKEAAEFVRIMESNSGVITSKQEHVGHIELTDYLLSKISENDMSTFSRMMDATTEGKRSLWIDDDREI